MAKYRKLPVVIEAERFEKGNENRAYNFVTCNAAADWNESGNPILKIQTLEGVMTATLGDWIIRGVAGEFYPCKPDVFEATYEPVGDEV